MKTGFALALIMLACLGSARAGEARVAGEVVDSVNGTPLPCRVYLRDATGAWLFVTNRNDGGTSLRYNKVFGGNTNSVETHTTLSKGTFEAELAPGEYTVRVEHGKDYLPAVRQFTVSNNEAELRIPLTRFLDMPSRGWFSGDTHVHRPPADLPNVQLAEDVNVVFPMVYWTTDSTVAPARSDKNMAGDFGLKPVEIDPLHGWYPVNSEYEIFRVGEKNHTLGAFVVINHKQPLDLPALPLKAVAQRVREEGGLIDLEKHNWPWTFALAPLISPDLFELANNHNWATEFGVRNWGVPAADWMPLKGKTSIENERDWITYGWEVYYGLLNCGFHLHPTASTGNGVHPVPLGHSRVYVHLPGGFSYETWIKGLAAGRSFVTTGPMILATANNADPGEPFHFPEGESRRFRIKGEVISQERLTSLELVVSGRVDRSIYPANRPRTEGGFASQFQVDLELSGSGWFALRCFEGRPAGGFAFAHTSPWRVDVEGSPLRPQKRQAEYFLSRVREEVGRNKGVIPEEAQKEFEAALVEWQRIAATASE